MDELKRFLGKEFNLSLAKDTVFLSGLGLSLRYAPDEPDDFDEFEFGLDHKGKQDVAFLVAIEKGKIARMLFGKTVKDDPDMLKPMSDEELAQLMNDKQELLIKFFEKITL